MNETYYTIPEVARLLKISPTKAYAWAQQGLIPCVKIGKNVRVRESELNQWLEEQLQKRDLLSRV